MGDYIEPADLAEADANAADYPTVAAQQCGLPEGLDATDMDMIRRGDMLGPVLGARVATLIQSQAARIAALEDMVSRAQLNVPDHYTNWHSDARSLLNGERKG